MKQFIKTMIVGLCIVAILTAFPFSVSAKPKKLSKSVKVGDTVYFGKYEQDGNEENGKEKIEWKVLDKKGNKALLISKDILDIKPYHKESLDITWEKSSLRKWLNKEFLKEAFSSKEKEKIQKSKIENKDNKVYGIKGGNNTKDQVFLLSVDEAKKYFKSNEERSAEMTKYGIKKLANLMGEDVTEFWFSEKNNWDWWLRSPGRWEDFAVRVGIGGSINEYGYGIFYGDEGVRPAIWVNL